MLFDKILAPLSDGAVVIFYALRRFQLAMQYIDALQKMEDVAFQKMMRYPIDLPLDGVYALTTPETVLC